MKSKFIFDLEGELANAVAIASPRWTWKEHVCRPSGIVIDSDDGPIAHVTRARSLRDYELFGMEVAIWTHSNALGGCRPIFEANCRTWSDGVKMVEQWLDEIPIWGTPDKVEWRGLMRL